MNVRNRNLPIDEFIKYGPAKLKALGFKFKDLIPYFSINELQPNAYELNDFYVAGYSIEDLHEYFKKFEWYQSAYARIMVRHYLSAGYEKGDIIKACETCDFDLKSLIDIPLSIDELRNLGYSLEEIKSHCSLSYLLAYPGIFEELDLDADIKRKIRKVRPAANLLREAGLKIDDLYELGYDLNSILCAEYRPRDFLNAPVIFKSFIQSVFSAKDFAKEGISLKEIKEKCGLVDYFDDITVFYKFQDFIDADLNLLHFYDPKYLKDAGYSLKLLLEKYVKEDGNTYSREQILSFKRAGYTLADFIGAGVSLNNLLNVNYDSVTSVFDFEELFESGAFDISEFEEIFKNNLGYDVIYRKDGDQIEYKNNDYEHEYLPIYTLTVNLLKSGRIPLAKIKQMIPIPLEIVYQYCSEPLKEITKHFPLKELKKFYTPKEIIYTNNFSYRQLRNAGFTRGNLLKYRKKIAIPNSPLQTD